MPALGFVKDCLSKEMEGGLISERCDCLITMRSKQFAEGVNHFEILDGPCLRLWRGKLPSNFSHVNEAFTVRQDHLRHSKRISMPPILLD